MGIKLENPRLRATQQLLQVLLLWLNRCSVPSHSRAVRPPCSHSLTCVHLQFCCDLQQEKAAFERFLQLHSRRHLKPGWQCHLLTMQMRFNASSLTHLHQMTACLRLRSELQALRRAPAVNMLCQFQPVQEVPALSHKIWQLHKPSLKASLHWMYLQDTFHQAVGNMPCSGS